MSTVELQVEDRAGHGKGVARRLRVAGRVPGVVYSGGTPAVSVSFSRDDFVAAMNGPMGRNTQFKLAGGEDANGRVVIVRDIQKSAVQREVLHVDLYELDPTKPIVVSVPVHLVGDALGVKEGGMLRHIRRTIEVRCVPSLIPEFIQLDVSSLNLGNSLGVTDLDLPEGIEAVYRHEFAICRVLVPRGLDEDVGDEGDEDAEGEEGDAPAATAGDDASDGEG